MDTPKTESEARLNYFEKHLDDLNNRFFAFIEKHEEQMDKLAISIAQKDGLYEEKFIRKTELTLMLRNVELEVKGINNSIQEAVTTLSGMTQYSDMLGEIKQERDSLRLKVYNYVHEGIIAIVAIASGYLFWKNK